MAISATVDNTTYSMNTHNYNIIQCLVAIVYIYPTSTKRSQHKLFVTNTPEQEINNNNEMTCTKT